MFPTSLPPLRFFTPASASKVADIELENVRELDRVVKRLVWIVVVVLVGGLERRLPRWENKDWHKVEGL